MKRSVSVFRADRRRYAVNDTMAPPGDHLCTLDDDHRQAEMLIREGHARGAELRAKHLQVFLDEAWARKYWALKGDGRYLYEACVSCADVLHTGDMDIFNEITPGKTPNENAELVRRYWASEQNPNKKIELIVRGAVVTRILGSPDDQKGAQESLLSQHITRFSP